jgi:hypothetical protein
VSLTTTDAKLSALLAELLSRGLEVSFAQDRASYLATITEGGAVDLSTGIGDTMLGALEAAAAGLEE